MAGPARARRQTTDYLTKVSPEKSTKAKLAALAEQRTSEGYMAEVQAEGKGRFLFIEHHCPICSAAEQCVGLCQSELEVFREVLGQDVRVERTQHIVSGNTRCVYEVTPTEPFEV